MIGPKKNRSYRPNKAGGKTFRGNKDITNLYDHIWRSYRERYLKINYRCYVCGERASVVDHLIPHKGDKALFEKTDNHIPLCERHHNTATALFDKRYRVGQSIMEKLRWLSTTRSSFDQTFKIKVLPDYGQG